MAPTKHTNKPTPSRRVTANPISARKTAAKATKTKPCKQIYAGKNFVLTGSLLATSGSVSHDQVSNWITLHGGTVHRDVTDETTHLICSVEAYGKKNPAVQKARKVKKCKIVTFDWIEDCLISKPNKPRLLSEKNYTLDKALKRIQKGKKGQEESKQKFEEGVRASKEVADSKLHHVYYDTTGFEYKILLTRVILGSKMQVEKYVLYLFESHALPPTYMCAAKYTRVGRPTSFWREKMSPKMFYDAFRDFKHFFRQTTGWEWDLRLEGSGKQIEDRFIYMRPVLGRPVGLLPQGYVKPEDRVVEEVGEEKGSGSGSESESGSGSGENDGSDADDEDDGEGDGDVKGVVERAMREDSLEVDGTSSVRGPRGQTPPGQAVWVSSDEEGDLCSEIKQTSNH